MSEIPQTELESCKENLNVPHVESSGSTLNLGSGSTVAGPGVQHSPGLTELHSLARADKVSVAVQRVGHNVDTTVSLTLGLQQGVVVDNGVLDCRCQTAAAGREGCRAAGGQGAGDGRHQRGPRD